MTDRKRDPKPTQAEIVLEYLLRGGWLDMQKAMNELGTSDLHARVHYLRADGWPILTISRPEWKYARLVLIGAEGKAANDDE